MKSDLKACGNLYQETLADDWPTLVNDTDDEDEDFCDEEAHVIIDEQPTVRQYCIPTERNPGLYVTVTIGGLVVSALIDTGAETTVLSAEMRRALVGFRADGQESACIQYAGKNTRADGIFWKGVEFQLGTRAYKHDLVEADINDPMILGMDFMRGRLASIDLIANELVMTDGERVAIKKMSVPSDMGERATLHLCERVSVPPQCEMAIKVTMKKT